MKTLCFSIFCLLLLYSCKQSNSVTQNNTSSYRIKLHEGVWYSNFKNEVFIRCLKKLYPEALGASIDSTDASSTANIEWLNYRTDVLQVMDSLANEFAKRKEALWAIENKRVTMNVCLGYRNSTELDSIATSLYKKLHSQKD